MPKRFMPIKNLLLAGSAVLVALALGEMALRALNIARPADLPPQPLRPDVFVADADIGYRLWPSTRTCMRYPPNSHRVTDLISNSDGLASSRELSEHDPRPRVLVLGDSFTFGTGVGEGARYTEVVEEIEPRWRIDNVSMPGWGIDLMVRGLERYGSKVKPAVVVLAVYTDDFRRSDAYYAGTGYPFTKFELRNGQLVDVPFPEQTFLQRLRLVEFVRTMIVHRDREYFALNEALIDRFQALARQLGAEPVILFLPGRADTEVDRVRRGKLRQWAENRGMPFRDLTNLIQDSRTNENFLPENWHWSERGHRIAGEALHSLLSTSVLRDTDAKVDRPALRPPAWRSRHWSYCSDEASLSPR